jgi:hypothetical protein
MGLATERGVGGDAGGVERSDRVDRYVAEVSRLAADWEEARSRFESSVRQRVMALRRADRRLRRARCGLDQVAWDALLVGRLRVSSTRNSQAVFRALRQRPAVEAAEVHQADIEAATRAATDRAWAALRDVGSDVLESGLSAEAITGVSRRTLVRVVRISFYPDRLSSATASRVICSLAGASGGQGCESTSKRRR